MAPPHQRHEAFALDPRSGSQTEGLNAGAQPHTGCLTAAGVVVLRAGGDLPLVVLELTRGGAELSDRQHATAHVEAEISNAPEPPVAARDRPLSPPESLVMKGSPVRFRASALKSRWYSALSEFSPTAHISGVSPKCPRDRRTMCAWIGAESSDGSSPAGPRASTFAVRRSARCVHRPLAARVVFV
jgi:hypothetical protein